MSYRGAETLIAHSAGIREIEERRKRRNDKENSTTGILLTTDLKRDCKQGLVFSN